MSEIFLNSLYSDVLPTPNLAQIVLYVGIWAPRKNLTKILCLIVYNSAAHFPIVLKSGRLVRYEIM